MSQVRGSAALLAALFAAAIATAVFWNPPPPAPFRPIGESQIPHAVAGYVASDTVPGSVSEEARRVLSSASIVSRTYMRGAAVGPVYAPIEFILVGGTDRSALHDPRSCLIGSGWAIQEDRATPFTAGTRTVPAHTCRIINENLPDKPAVDLLYLYVVDGKVIESVTQIRAQMLASAVIGRKNTPVYFLRFLRPVERTGEDNLSLASSAQSSEILKQFAGAMWQQLPLTRQ